ncbi:MAG: cysteine desulfurase family protein [Candidatus Nanoarchaeia archaeon]
MTYVDNAATTPVDERVVEEMKPYFSEEYGNPGSPHSIGFKAKEAVENSRNRIAKILNCSSSEVLFTSSGTESVNLALKGVAEKFGKGHIITTCVEHHCVLDTCKYLEKRGFSVTYLPVDIYGRVREEDLRNAIREDTILVSIIYGSNEIGTISKIKSLAKVAHEKGVLFHTDACQAGRLLLDVEELGVDLLSLNSSKVYGPKGVGLLYRKEGIELEPLLHGGQQEFGLRAGTHNVPGIVGFAKALELMQKFSPEETARLVQLRDKLITGLLQIPKTLLNGHSTERLPDNVNITFCDLDGRALLEMMNEQGIYASMGSACTSHILEASHVIIAIGIGAELAHGTLRFTLGRHTTHEDIDHMLDIIPGIVEELSAKSPVKTDMKFVEERKCRLR